MTSDWKIIKGTSPTLLIAAHNYPHLRKGKLKPEDLFTGKFVEKLAKYNKSWAIISRKVQLDPNWYPNSMLRTEVKKLIVDEDLKVVLDIHGRNQSSPNMIEVLPNNSFKAKYGDYLEKFTTLSFKNNDQLTISEDLDRIKIPALEIEIRKDGRTPGTAENKMSLAEITELLSEITN